MATTALAARSIFARRASRKAASPCWFAYSAQQHGATSLEVMSFQVSEDGLASMRSLDIDWLPDPVQFMSKYSALWAGAPDRGYDWLMRGTPFGAENSFFQRGVRPAAFRGRREVSEWRTFALRVLKSSWGVAIDLRARAVTAAEPPTGSLRATERVLLDVRHVPLPAVDVTQLLRGLRVVAGPIEAAMPGEDYVVVEVVEVSYTPTDYQPDGVAAVMIGWAMEEFDLAQPDIDVHFEKSENRYVFAMPDW